MTAFTLHAVLACCMHDSPAVHAQACNRINAQCVPLYDSLGENAIEFIINHSESSITFVSTEKLPALAKALSKTTDVLKTVIYWGAGHPASVEARPTWPCMRACMTSSAFILMLCKS